MESTILMYAERDIAGDFEFAFFCVKLESTDRGLLIRNEGMVSLLRF